jgi:transposase-like protein
MYSESEATYTILFNKLKERELEKVWLAVSDAHLGLQAAIRKCFVSGSWQRCKVNFQRNILAYVGQKAKANFAKQLKKILLQPDKDHSIEMAILMANEFLNKFLKAIECLFNGLEESLNFYDFPLLDSRKIASKNGC